MRSATDGGADRSGRATTAVRTHRRYSVLAEGGMDGVFRTATALRSSGLRVRDFSADVREGVGLSCLTCTVSVTSAESALLADHLRQVPDVVAVDPC